MLLAAAPSPEAAPRPSGLFFGYRATSNDRV